MHPKRCFFIGHRDTPEEILYALRMAIEKHIVRYGVKEFVVGDYGAFDRYARTVLLEAKQQYHDCAHPVGALSEAGKTGETLGWVSGYLLSSHTCWDTKEAPYCESQRVYGGVHRLSDCMHLETGEFPAYHGCSV